ANPRGSVDAAYRAALFLSAFTPSYYRGFVDSIGAVGVGFSEPAAQVVTDGSSSRRGAAIGLVAAASLLAAATAISGGVAIAAKHDFDQTSLQRPALDAYGRYTATLGTAITTGILSIVLGATGGAIWPKNNSTQIESLP